MTEIELSQEELKKIYKDLVKYSLSDSFKAILDKWNKKGEEILSEIKKEIETRAKLELVKSELDKVVIYKDFLLELIKLLDESAGAKKFKEELIEQVERCNSHIELKVEVGFDAPIYSLADILKAERGNWINIDKKLQEFISKYAPKDENKVDLDPFEK